MVMHRAIFSALILALLAMQASSQGYMGTVSTGTGIIPPITVGSGSISGANVGGAAAQADMIGDWSLDFKDMLMRHLDLAVLQNGDVVWGQGNMTLEGSIRQVFLSGSIGGQRMEIFILPLDGIEVYRMDLDSSGTAISGRYTAYAADGASWTGTATGTIASASSESQNVLLGSGVNPAASAGAFVGKSSEPYDTSSSGTSVLRRTYSSTFDGTTTTTTSGDTSIATNYN